MKALTAPIFMLLLLFPIAVLAADAAAPTAPAVQSAAWTIEDYLKAGFSGATGGLLSGFMALIGIWLKNKSDEKNTKDKIDADKEALRINHQNQIDKLCYEEKKQICFELLAELSEYNIFQRKLDVTKASLLYAKTTFACQKTYSKHAFALIKMVVCDKILRMACDNNTDKFGDKITTADFLERLSSYNKFYNVFVIITHKMLKGEELLPFQEWNLDDFEGSVQLDYRQSLP